ncbi:MAG: rhodanese-like domain-containing protein [Roseivirga sp.]|nr:rhodanese-like domain-containing protein [Roseivirga sp.]
MEDITVQQLKARQAANEALNILDVREEWEYEEDNMGARLMPLGDLPARIDEIADWKDQEMIVHCKSGGRSGRAKKYLESQGFTKVRNMLGGMLAYREED